MAKYDCPICGQYMDFIVISHRNHAFVDGQCYSKMCFGCFHVPMDYEYTYSPQGDILDIAGPFYDYKHLNSAAELFKQGSTDSLEQAEKCVAAVSKVIRAAGSKKLEKLKLHRPEPDYDLNEEYERQEIERQRKLLKGMKRAG